MTMSWGPSRDTPAPMRCSDKTKVDRAKAQSPRGAGFAVTTCGATGGGREEGGSGGQGVIGGGGTSIIVSYLLSMTWIVSIDIVVIPKRVCRSPQGYIAMIVEDIWSFQSGIPKARKKERKEKEKNDLCRGIDIYVNDLKPRRHFF